MSKNERTGELGWIRTALDRAEASVVALSGPPGSGATRLALTASGDHAHRHYFRVPPLPEPLQRAALATTLAAGYGEDGPDPGPGDRSWYDLLSAAEQRGGTSILVVDDAHRLEQSRARFLPALRDVLAAARERASSLHLVLVAPEQPRMDEALEAALGLLRLELGPLTFRAALPWLPGSDAAARLRAYTTFGGMPGHLRRLDPAVSASTNLRRLVVDEGSALRDQPLDTVERATQTPARYVAILRALSGGEADWGTVHAGVPDISASGQLAPYLKRLAELGLIEVRRSLDAGPRSRNRRYRITDPFTAFWYRFVLPHREALETKEGEERFSQAARAGIEAHVASILPAVCRQYMRHDAIETMGSNARECGSLWGAGYDIPVAGILASGAAFYGRPVPPGSDGATERATLDREIRETRYGFGREHRLRILFVQGEPPPGLAREAARRHDVFILDEGALAGEG